MQSELASVFRQHLNLCRSRFAYTFFLFRRWDGNRDGSLDSFGWVADMVNTGVGKPADMLCPAVPIACKSTTIIWE